MQPYGNYTQKEAAKLGKELGKRIWDWFGVDMDCEVLSALPLADSLLNKEKTRYRADKIINAMSSKADAHSIYIGLTHRDISCSLRGKPDWGVQGLSLIPKKACVVSTYRVKNKGEFWKVVMHEFIHTYFEYRHCPKDDSKCLMQDANGNPSFKNKEGLCQYCKKQLGM